MKGRWTEEERANILQFYGLSSEQPTSWDQVYYAPPSTNQQNQNNLNAKNASNIPAGSRKFESSEQILHDLANEESLGTHALVNEDKDPLEIKDSSVFKQTRLINARSTSESVAGGISLTAASTASLSMSADLLPIDERVSVTSPQFDPCTFLNQIHGDTVYSALLTGRDRLSKSIKVHEAGMKNLVKENFGRFVTVKNAIEGVYVDMKAKRLLLSDGMLMAQAIKSIGNAQSIAQTTFKGMLSRREREADLNFKLEIFKQYSFIFDLAHQLSRQIKGGQEDYRAAITAYSRAKRLVDDLCASPLSGGIEGGGEDFCKVVETVKLLWNGPIADLLRQLSADLVSKLEDPMLDWYGHARALGMLQSLNKSCGSQDPLAVYRQYFEIGKTRLLQNLSNSYRATKNKMSSSKGRRNSIITGAMDGDDYAENSLFAQQLKSLHALPGAPHPLKVDEQCRILLIGLQNILGIIRAFFGEYSKFFLYLTEKFQASPPSPRSNTAKNGKKHDEGHHQIPSDFNPQALALEVSETIKEYAKELFSLLNKTSSLSLAHSLLEMKRMVDANLFHSSCIHMKSLCSAIITDKLLPTVWACAQKDMPKLIENENWRLYSADCGNVDGTDDLNGGEYCLAHTLHLFLKQLAWHAMSIKGSVVEHEIPLDNNQGENDLAMIAEWIDNETCTNISLLVETFIDQLASMGIQRGGEGEEEVEGNDVDQAQSLVTKLEQSNYLQQTQTSLAQQSAASKLLTILLSFDRVQTTILADFGIVSSVLLEECKEETIKEYVRQKSRQIVGCIDCGSAKQLDAMSTRGPSTRIIHLLLQLTNIHQEIIYISSKLTALLMPKFSVLIMERVGEAVGGDDACPFTLFDLKFLWFYLGGWCDIAESDCDGSEDVSESDSIYQKYLNICEILERRQGDEQNTRSIDQSMANYSYTFSSLLPQAGRKQR